MKNIIESYNKQFESFEDYILKNKLVEYVGEKALRFSELSEKYVWKKNIEIRKSKGLCHESCSDKFCSFGCGNNIWFGGTK